LRAARLPNAEEVENLFSQLAGAPYWSPRAAPLSVEQLDQLEALVEQLEVSALTCNARQPAYCRMR
jgi:hypothetical protein